MNDICVRTELNEGKAPDILICMVINYYDFDIFRDKIDQYKEKETTEVMILHYKNDLMVIYDSLYFMTEFECHGNDPNCVPINFFNVYYKSILDELYSSASNNETYKQKYNSLKENEAFKKLEEKIINIAETETKDLLTINIDNFDPDKVLYSLELSAQIKDGEIIYEDLDEKVYVFPILSSFDYISDSDSNSN